MERDDLSRLSRDRYGRPWMNAAREFGTLEAIAIRALAAGLDNSSGPVKDMRFATAKEAEAFNSLCGGVHMRGPLLVVRGGRPVSLTFGFMHLRGRYLNAEESVDTTVYAIHPRVDHVCLGLVDRVNGRPLLLDGAITQMRETLVRLRDDLSEVLSKALGQPGNPVKIEIVRDGRMKRARFCVMESDQRPTVFLPRKYADKDTELTELARITAHLQQWGDSKSPNHGAARAAAGMSPQERVKSREFAQCELAAQHAALATVTRAGGTYQPQAKAVNDQYREHWANVVAKSLVDFGVATDRAEWACRGVLFPPGDYEHKDFKRARKEALTRVKTRHGWASWVCQGCCWSFLCDSDLEAHHWAVRYPSASNTDADDLTMLCRECHQLLTTMRRANREGWGQRLLVVFLRKVEEVYGPPRPMAGWSPEGDIVGEIVARRSGWVCQGCGLGAVTKVVDQRRTAFCGDCCRLMGAVRLVRASDGDSGRLLLEEAAEARRQAGRVGYSGGRDSGTPGAPSTPADRGLPGGRRIDGAGDDTLGPRCR